MRFCSVGRSVLVAFIAALALWSLLLGCGGGGSGNQQQSSSESTQQVSESSRKPQVHSQFQFIAV